LVILGTVAPVDVGGIAVVDSVDQKVWEWFVGNPFMTPIAEVVTSVGVVYVLLPLSVVCGVYIWRRTQSALLAAVPWIAVQMNSLVVANLKDWTAVARPPREFWIVHASAESFPSGHVANTTAFVVAIVVLLSQIHPDRQRLFMVTGLVSCAAMAWSRLALNVHWLSDVVAGWCVGAATTLVVLRLVQRIKSQRESQLQTRG